MIEPLDEYDRMRIQLREAFRPRYPYDDRGDASIYVVEAPEAQRFKVGFSSCPNPQSRLDSLVTASPLQLVLHMVIVGPLTRTHEHGIHDALHRYGSHGEWFSELPPWVLDMLANAAGELATRYTPPRQLVASGLNRGPATIRKHVQPVLTELSQDAQAHIERLYATLDTVEQEKRTLQKQHDVLARAKAKLKEQLWEMTLARGRPNLRPR